MRLLTLGFTLLVLSTTNLLGVRVKDLARVQGSRQNQLLGYGVVIGLAGTGDSTANNVTLQTVANFFNRFGLTVPEAAIKANNSAIVVVTADLPPFVRSGSKIDVHVASLGDCKSLQGGVLIQTPLVGADGQVYAVAQGPMVLGGFFAGNTGSGSANVQKNHPTVAMITEGALIEREVPMELVTAQNTLDLVLRDPDFTTAARLAEVLNSETSTEMAVPVDAGTIRVSLPPDVMDPTKQVLFISRLENMDVEPDTVTRVVINERTGTIVANSRVKISSVAVAHGNLTISIATSEQVSQPLPFAATGATATTQSTTASVSESHGELVPLPDLPTIQQVAAALNRLGASPRDMMTIFQALKQAGALQAELVIR
jgi:flagellar P-ring protein FlgI